MKANKRNDHCNSKFLSIPQEVPQLLCNLCEYTDIPPVHFSSRDIQSSFDIRCITSLSTHPYTLHGLHAPIKRGTRICDLSQMPLPVSGIQRELRHNVYVSLRVSPFWTYSKYVCIVFRRSVLAAPSSSDSFASSFNELISLPSAVSTRLPARRRRVGISPRMAGVYDVIVKDHQPLYDRAVSCRRTLEGSLAT